MTAPTRAVTPVPRGGSGSASAHSSSWPWPARSGGAHSELDLIEVLEPGAVRALLGLIGTELAQRDG